MTTTIDLQPFVADDNVDVHISTGANNLRITIYRIIVTPDPELVELEIYGAGQESTGEEILHITTSRRDLPPGMDGWRSSKHLTELLEDMDMPFWAERLVRNVVDMAHSSLPVFEVAA